MRIQCDACAKATASIMCCADDAALCVECDERLHAAGQLANKHQRVSLKTALEDSPQCDICQEKSAFFFCLEDRALLCRDCDFSIHSATALSSAHQRFLLPGTKVALEALRNDSDSEATEQQPSVEDFVRRPLSSIIKAPSIITNNYQQQQQQQQGMNAAFTNSNNTSGHAYAHDHSRPTAQLPAQTYASPAPPVKMAASYTQKSMGVSPASAAYSSAPVNGGGVGGDGPYGLHGMCSAPPCRSSIMDFLSEAIPNWRVHELLNTPDLVDGYSLGDVPSFKPNVSNLEEDYDWTSDRSLFDELQFYVEKFQEVPQMGAPPPVSDVMAGNHLVRGLSAMHVKGNATQSPIVPHKDEEFLVPDLRLHLAPTLPTVAKRRRQLLQV